MFKTTVGATSADDDYLATAYLRPETAQGIFINFKNVLDTSRRKLPFGIAQIGKAFRNEVTPGNFIFRTREFEQMEMEYFCRAEDAAEIHQQWIDDFQKWFHSLGISPENLKLYEQNAKELAHYAARTVDILYRFFPEREDEDADPDFIYLLGDRTGYDTITAFDVTSDTEFSVTWSAFFAGWKALFSEVHPAHIFGADDPAAAATAENVALREWSHEGAILRYVFFHSIALASLVGLLVTLQAR